MSCNTNLPNPGSRLCAFDMSKVRGLIFASTTDGSDANNKLLVTEANFYDYWKERFNMYSHTVDPLKKFVPIPDVYESKPNQADPTMHDVDDYLAKIKDGLYNIEFNLNQANPEYIGKLKDMEGLSLATYLATEEGVWGIVDGTDFLPVELVGLSVPNFNLPTFEAISKETIKFRLKYGTDMNRISMITPLDGSTNPVDISKERYAWALTDGDLVVTSPAVTGCTFVASVSNLSRTGKKQTVGVTGITFDEVHFVDQADGTVIHLAGAGSITESNVTPGSYVVNEAALLTTAHTYDLRISKSKYDIIQADVVVP
jgi:hypothetical protein